MKCSRCGGENQSGLLVCAHCGCRLPTSDPFHKLGDLISTQAKTTEALSEERDTSRTSVPKADPSCFSKLGDLSGEKTPAEINDTEKTVDQQPQYDPKGKTGFANLGDLRDDQNEHQNVDADRKNNNNLDNRYTDHKDNEHSKERKTDHGDDKGKRHTKTAAFSKKKWWAIAACLAIVLILAVGIQTVRMVRKTAEQTDEERAVAALDEKLNIPIKEIDTEGIETPAFLIDIEERNGYEILSFEKTENGAVALVRVYAPDVYGVAKDLDANGTFSNEAELADALSRALRDAPIVEKQVSISYTLTEEGYVPNLTAEFLDAYYGGVYRLRDEMMADAVETEE